MVVVDDNDVIIENTIIDDAQRPNLVDIDGRAWSKVAEGQVVDVGGLDLVVNIGLRHERGSGANTASASLGAPEANHVFL